MSKTSKLDRMAKTVLETTGLTYNTSGQTVELNFFPNSTNQGVSVPLVLAGNTNSAALNTPSLSGFPYALIEGKKPANTNGGTFYAYNQATDGVQGFNGTDVGRTRELNTTIVDEIGVVIHVPVGTGPTNKGPGNFFNLPLGKYYINAFAHARNVQNSTLFLHNITQQQIVLLGDVGGNIYSYKDFVSGRFEVSSTNDDYALTHVGSNQVASYGFGYGAVSRLTNVYVRMELWKIG